MRIPESLLILPRVTRRQAWLEVTFGPDVIWKQYSDFHDRAEQIRPMNLLLF